MSTDARVIALQERHAALEMALDAEATSGTPSEWEIKRIKVEKLRIKDELFKLEPTSV